MSKPKCNLPTVQSNQELAEEPGAQQSNYQALVNEAKSLLGVNDDDPQQQKRRAIREAARYARKCAQCGRKLRPDDPIWRKRLPIPGLFGRPHRVLAPVCKRCHEKETRVRRKWGFSEKQYTNAKPCEGCGRPVHNTIDFVYRQHSFCSDNCSDKVLPAKAAAAARQQRAEDRGTRTCAGCATVFTPTRTDARFCSASCKQRAYRQRVTGTKKVHVPPFKSRNGRTARKAVQP
jgi:hypothetical protein